MGNNLEAAAAAWNRAKAEAGPGIGMGGQKGVGGGEICIPSAVGRWRLAVEAADEIGRPCAAAMAAAESITTAGWRRCISNSFHTAGPRSCVRRWDGWPREIHGARRGDPAAELDFPKGKRRFLTPARQRRPSSDTRHPLLNCPIFFSSMSWIGRLRVRWKEGSQEGRKYREGTGRPAAATPKHNWPPAGNAIPGKFGDPFVSGGRRIGKNGSLLIQGVWMKYLKGHPRRRVRGWMPRCGNGAAGPSKVGLEWGRTAGHNCLTNG
jgi:hypothetical protein